jgi:hypothetical protein
MKYSITSILVLLMLVFCGQVPAKSGDSDAADQEFPPLKKVRIKLVLSDCELTASSNGKIQVHHESTYDEYQYRAIVEERGSRLYIEEKFYGRDMHGGIHWKVSVPPETEVEFNSATGSLTVTGFKGDLEGQSGTGKISVTNSEGQFDLNSGTGSVEIEDTSGEFDLNSGTGTVRISDCSGDFDANSGTGRCRASEITIVHDGEFNSGTGSVLVEKPMGDDFDLRLNSGTGDAVLDMKKQPLAGYFEFRAHARRGEIECPEKFDTEEKGGSDNDEYVLKSFTRGKKSPRYFISTGTGTAELKL